MLGEACLGGRVWWIVSEQLFPLCPGRFGKMRQTSWSESTQSDSVLILLPQKECQFFQTYHLHSEVFAMSSFSTPQVIIGDCLSPWYDSPLLSHLSSVSRSCSSHLMFCRGVSPPEHIQLIPYKSVICKRRYDLLCLFGYNLMSTLYSYFSGICGIRVFNLKIFVNEKEFSTIFSITLCQKLFFCNNGAAEIRTRCPLTLVSWHLFLDAKQ